MLAEKRPEVMAVTWESHTAAARSGIEITDFALRQFTRLRAELNGQFAAAHAPAARPINPASRS